VLRRIARDGSSVRGASRRELVGFPTGVEMVPRTELSGEFDWRSTLVGCDMVVHAAARVHLVRDSAPDPLAEFRRVNVDGTLRLARQAAQVGVRRFVFLSSIKVNGEKTFPDRPFTSDDRPAPEDAYAVSKQEAEEGLHLIGSETGMEIVIIRPALVYGPGVKANFQTMMRWISRGIPLPFGAIRNRRSLIGLDNLVDLVSACLRHPAAANQTFLASDGEDLSTTELLRRTGAALNRPARLVPIPQGALEAAATLFGTRNMARRLLGSLQVDIGRTRKLLDWAPPVSVDQQLRSTADWFLKRERGFAG
jgi:nucleoside-diphosphate-sugar epimerase